MASAYLTWTAQTITDFSDQTINSAYNQGYLFTRESKGAMQQTRSIRIDLSHFELSSENRRILRKTDEITLQVKTLPSSDYDWSIGKLAKDFYETKFGPGVFSANKIKELFTNPEKSNFNRIFCYGPGAQGYCIACETNELIHYAYPFYDLRRSPSDMGMAMMVRAVTYAKEQKKKYIYLGSAQRPSDTYKLQFQGVEWFDGERWSSDSEKLKKILKENEI